MYSEMLSQGRYIKMNVFDCRLSGMLEEIFYGNRNSLFMSP